MTVKWKTKKIITHLRAYMLTTFNFNKLKTVEMEKWLKKKHYNS
jgi:hypothetical protein